MTQGSLSVAGFSAVPAVFLVDVAVDVVSKFETTHCQKLLLIFVESQWERHLHTPMMKKKVSWCRSVRIYYMYIYLHFDTLVLHYMLHRYI